MVEIVIMDSDIGLSPLYSELGMILGITTSLIAPQLTDLMILRLMVISYLNQMMALSFTCTRASTVSPAPL